MASIYKGILGGIVGKLDGLQGQVRNGHPTISQHKEGSDIQWSLQTDAERTKMSFLSSRFRQLPRALVNQMFYEGNPRIQPWFRMVKANYDHCTISTYTPHNDMIGKHTLPQPITNNVWAQLRANGATTWSWRNVLLRPKESMTDVVIPLMYFPDTQTFFYLTNPTLRSAGSISVNTGARAIGTRYVIILIMRSANGKWVSKAKVFSGTVIN